MAVTLVTFANLGKKTNLGTFEVASIIRLFSQKNELDRIICQLHKDFYFPRTYSAVPSLIRYPIRIGEKLLRRTISRQLSERLFDLFAEWKVGHSAVAFFHGGHFLSRTLRRAHKNGSVVVDLTRSAHLATNAEIERAELELLHVKDYEGTYQQMSERHTHQNEFDYIVATSEFVKSSYIANGYPPERIFVAYPDVDFARFAPRTERSPGDTVFRVVYIAYTTPLKGLTYLLDAWDTLRLPNAELVLVGGYGDMSEDLKRQYGARIAHDSSITWVGSNHTPETYLRDASVFVFPSLTEGFGKVTEEAMACEVPVITTEHARGIVEDGKTGFVVPIRNAQAIAEKIRYFYDHPDHALSMGKEARKAVERKKPFNEAVYEIYQEIKRREHLV